MGKLSKLFLRRQPSEATPALAAGVRKLANDELIHAHLEQRLDMAHPARQRSRYFQEAAPSVMPLGGFGVKVIAFHKSDVSWSEVVVAQPQYVGHEQPHIPGALGFYDQQASHVLRAQVAMARAFGVHAFCFSCTGQAAGDAGTDALAQFVAEPSLDLHFCCILTAEAEIDGAFTRCLTRCFSDLRYILVDGRPLVLERGMEHRPDREATLARWRVEAVKGGWPGLYVVSAESADAAGACVGGVDAAVEMPPQRMHAVDITEKMAWFNQAHTGHVFDYTEAALRMAGATSDEHRLFKTVMPSWDTEPVHPGSGTSFKGAAPHAFAQWLRAAARLARRNPEGERFVFVNAWNDWAHGAHLEPDVRHGHAYLNALSATLAEVDSDVTLRSFADTLNGGFRRAHDVVIFAHFFYEDVLNDMLDAHLTSLAGLADLHVSVTENMSVASLARLHAIFPNMRVHLCENRGRDVKPFIEMYRLAANDGYELAFKVHGKRSPHLADGAAWREKLIDPLIGSRAVFERNVGTLRADSKTTLLVPKAALHQLNEAGFNQRWLNELLRQTGHAERVGRYKWKFAAGTMFAFRFTALAALLNEDAISLNSFEDEAGQLDGTYAHALERMLGLFATAQGGKIVSC